MQPAERAAAHAGPLPGAQRDLDGGVLGPAVAEFPGLLDPLGDVGRPLAGRSEDGTQLIVDRIGEHRAERLVGAGQLGYLPLEAGQIGLGGTVDGAEVQLRTEVDEHLVASRRRAVGDGLDGVQRLDLVDADLGRQRDQRRRGVGGVERQIIGTRPTTGRGGGGGGRGRLDRCRLGPRGCGVRRSGCFLEVRFGIGVGREQHRRVTLGVEHLGGVVRVLRQLERVGRQTRDGRRVLDADLDEALDAETARRLLDEQQILGFDPAHRAGELPGQQLDDELATQIRGPLVAPGVVVGQDFVERLGRHQVPDLLDEVAVEGERPRHQVGDVAPDQQFGVGTARHDPLEGAAEVGHADPQHRRVERHVDAGHQDERPLAAADLATPLDLLLQCLQPGDGARDRVLGAAQVEVDDLQKLSGSLGDLGDERRHVGVVEVDLRGTDGRQPVVRPSRRVARHDVVHLGTAVEHDLQQRGQLIHARHTGQRCVLTDRMAAGDRTLDERTLLTHLGDLSRGDRGHRDLGELRQVQHALGVVVVHTGGDQAGRVVTHDVQHREAQRLAGELVRRVPDLAGGLGPGPHVHAHALGLDALAGERVDGLRRRQLGGRRHDQLGADAGGDLDDLRTPVDADPVDAELDLVAGQHHAQESGRPAHQPGGRGGPAVGGGDRVLGGRGQPHAVHDGLLQPGQQRGGTVGVNRVVIAGDHSERTHVDRSVDHDVTPAPARGVGGVVGDGTARASGVGELGGAGAAADREPLLESDQHLVGFGCLGDGDADRDDATHFGVGGRLGGRGDDQVRLARRHRGQQVRRVVEVHQAQQALDDRETVVGERRTDRGEHRRPAQADQGVGHQRQAGGQRRTERRGDAGVVGDLLRIPRHAHPGGVVLHRRQGVRSVDAGRDGQHRAHRRRRVFDGDDRHAAVDGGRRQREADVDPDVGQRHAQRDRDLAGVVGRLLQARTGVRMGGAGLARYVVDLPLARRTDAVHRVDGGAPGPQHVGRVEHDGQRARHIGARLAARDHRNRRGAVGQHAVDDLLFETVQQFADGLVDAGDTGDGLGTGDDAHLVGGVARVVGLPQRVAAPPAADVLVDDRHEVDRLAGLLAQRHEERHIGRVQPHRLGVRIAGQQRGDRGVGVVQQRLAVGALVEQRLDGAGVLLVQTRLGPLEHGLEALPPGVGQPGAAGLQRVGGAVAVADGQLDVALQPPQVGHLTDVAEVRLGGVCHRGDDLVAALGDRVGVTGDLVEQPPAARGGVVDLVDVGAELAATAGHAVDGLARAHPGVGAVGLHEHLLDRRGGGGLFGGHRRGADEDAVDRHRGEAVGLGPVTGEIVRRPLGGTDAATDADGDVAVLAQIAIGGQQQIVEILPGVVATGPAALDVDDDVFVPGFGGDLDDGLDLVDRARLEHHMADADAVELLDQLDGLVELGDARGDDHAVDGRAGLARLLHQALTTDLQLPQVGVEEQRVELDRATGFQELAQLLDTRIEDLLGHLSPAGQLGPVAGVGRGGDDLGVHGGRRHPGQQDRGTAGESGELGRHLDRTVGQGDGRRGVAGPGRRDVGGGTDGEQAALTGARRGRHDADPEAADHRCGQAGHGVTGTQVDDPLGAGGGQTLDLGDPVDRAHEDGLGQFPGQLGVQAGAGGPLVDEVDTAGQARGVEADLDIELVEHGPEHRAAAGLVLALGLFFLGDLLAVQLEAGQLLRGSGDHDRTPAVADGQRGRQHRADVLGELVEEFGHPGGVDIGDRDHGRLVPAPDHAATPRHQGSGGADELADGEQLDVAVAAGLECLHGGDTL